MRLKSIIFKKFQNFILNNSNEEISSDDLEIALYGMEVIYSLSTKILLFLFISIIFGCTKKYFFVFLLIATIRSTSFGFHSNSEIGCYITTFLIIFGTIYLSTNCSFNYTFKIIICILSIISAILYAPADTEKKPLTNKTIRIILKIITLCSSLIFSFYTLNNNGFMSNAIICILIINSINISPILYNIFKRRYRNYEQY